MKTASEYGCDSSATCLCPACRGLATFERPRFFTGQLLTEAELNGEQVYVVDKNRLHNRYLHGCGVVCGLAVTCNDCDDSSVTIRAGYAIDPCGNDIVVQKDRRFDVMEAIDRCRAAGRRPEECDPLVPPDDPACADLAERWCIVVKYVEEEARAVAALRDVSSKVACSCGGHGHANGNGNGHSGCTCGGSKGSTTMVASAPAYATTASSLACEPTRIREGYRLEVVPAPDEEDEVELEGLAKIVTECRKATAALLAKAPDLDLDPDQLHQACCRFELEVRKYLGASDVLRCELRQQLADVHCPGAPQQDVDAAKYKLAVTNTVTKLKELLALHMFDCVCLALLPPCPPDPCDDRVVLACVTVRNGKILRVCNGHRQHVVTFPTLSYFLSAKPPLLGLVLAAALVTGKYDELLEALCCNEALGLLLGFDPPASNVPGGAKYPKYPATQATASNAGDVYGGYSLAAKQLAGAQVVAALAPSARSIDTSALVGETRSTALSRLKRERVQVHLAEAGTWPAEALARARRYTPDAVPRDAHLVLYVAGETVVGVDTLGPVEALERRVSNLDDRLAALEKQR
jgi:hypothetical protein